MRPLTPNDQSAIEAVVEPVCGAHGVDLVQVAHVTVNGEAVLRVLIDRPGSEAGPGHGVTVADCQSVSRDVGTALDEQDPDPVPGAYRLEVSSPGLDRPLVKLSDFARFSGREAKIQTRTPHPDGRGGQRQKFRGTLVGVDDEMVRLEVEGGELRLPHAEIAKAHVVHRFD